MAICTHLKLNVCVNAVNGKKNEYYIHEVAKCVVLARAKNKIMDYGISVGSNNHKLTLQI